MKNAQAFLQLLTRYCILNYVATWLAKGGRGVAGQSPSIGCHESSWTAAAAAGVVSNLPAGQLQKALKSCQHLPCLPPLSSSVAKPCPVSQSPLDFCHFSTLSRPSLTHLPSRPAQQLLFMLCHRFCLHFASSIASFSSLFLTTKNAQHEFRC